MTGVGRRLQALIPETGRTIIAPIDDSLIAGPVLGLSDMSTKLSDIAAGRPDAILAFPGQFERFGHLVSSMGWICNLTASTRRSLHTRKYKIADVRRALALGCEGVAVHVNVTSRFEGEMLSTLSDVVAEGRDLGVPILAIMYPRGEGTNGEDDNHLSMKQGDPSGYAELVAHSVRIAADLGASIVKTQYTGDIATFSKVVLAASPLPVVIAGGPILPVREALTMAAGAIAAGGAGVSYGRNVFGRDSSSAMLVALGSVVRDLTPVEDAMRVVERETG